MSSREELRLNTAAAAIAGFIQPAIFNPLDCLRVRWQVAAVNAREQSLLAFARGIVDREGFVRGLYLPGQPWNCVAVALSQGLRLGLYPTVRDSLLGSKSQSSVRPDGWSLLACCPALCIPALGSIVVAQMHSQAESQFAHHSRHHRCLCHSVAIGQARRLWCFGVP